MYSPKIPHPQITVDFNVPAPMRDGTVLYANIYHPSAEGTYPVILVRLPYSKDGLSGTSIPALRFAQSGYVCIIQDVRGTFTSEGDFYPLFYEANDGYDTVEWAAQLPYSNGIVGMYGVSYYGATQWLAAASRPPHLRAIVPLITATDYYEGWSYRGGAVQQGLMESWTTFMALSKIARPDRAQQPDVASQRNQLLAAYSNQNRAFEHLPVLDRPALAQVAPAYRNELLHPSDDEYRHPIAVKSRYNEITVPAFNIGGWYDTFLGGTIRSYLGMRAEGGSPEARQGQRLLIGPWSHGVFAREVGQVDFGLLANEIVIDLTGQIIRWLDYWLKGEQNGVETDPPVRLFVMGENCWRDEQEWPLARTRYTPYYLHSHGQANGLAGEGWLSLVPPTEEEPSDSFVYNPRNPVPTVGGHTLFAHRNVGNGAGPEDRRAVESRSDVLIYTTPPLAAPLEITGPITMKLWAKTSAPDTDWTAALVDVYPDGRAYLLADGILRARYRESFREPALLPAGGVICYTIDLWATSIVLGSGHQIRVEISSSNFPRFDRHPNTCGLVAEATERDLQPALQTIYHDATYSSYLTVPIIPCSEERE